MALPGTAIMTAADIPATVYAAVSTVAAATVASKPGDRSGRSTEVTRPRGASAPPPLPSPSTASRLATNAAQAVQPLEHVAGDSRGREVEGDPAVAQPHHPVEVALGSSGACRLATSVCPSSTAIPFSRSTSEFGAGRV